MSGDRDEFGFSSKPPRNLLWFGAAALAPPIITLVILGVIYALAGPLCGGRVSPLLLHAILVLTIAALVGIGVYGRRYFTRGEPLDSDTGTSVASFTAFFLLTITAICLLIVISQWIALFVMPCAY